MSCALAKGLHFVVHARWGSAVLIPVPHRWNVSNSVREETLNFSLCLSELLLTQTA